MHRFSEQEEALREEAEKNGQIHIARKWTQSPFIFKGNDSKGEKTPNPAYHPPISQTDDGEYVNDAGDPIPLDQIPAYILEQGAPPENTPERGSRKFKLEDAMTGALDRFNSQPTKPAAKKRGRPAKVQKGA